jgi:hypothetical protein
VDKWSSGALSLVAEDGILMGATAHQLVAVIELCKLVAADPGVSAAPCFLSLVSPGMFAIAYEEE